MHTARAIGVGQQVYSNYHAKNVTNGDKDTRFAGKSSPMKSSAAAQVMFGLAPDPTNDRLRKLEEEVLKDKSPIQQLLYRIGQSGGVMR